MEEPEAPAKFRLSDDHRLAAQEIAKKHITKRYRRKGCDRCGLTGVKGVTEENTILPCVCVDATNAYVEWYEYCSRYPELKARFCK